MPINMHYKKAQIQPGVIDFHGVVVFEAAGAINEALTITPGMVWTRAGVGEMVGLFRAGATVGHVVPTFTSIAAGALGNLYGFRVINPNNLLGGPSIFQLEVTDPSGTITDVSDGDGFAYAISVLNSSTKVQ